MLSAQPKDALKNAMLAQVRLAQALKIDIQSSIEKGAETLALYWNSMKNTSGAFNTVIGLLCFQNAAPLYRGLYTWR